MSLPFHSNFYNNCSKFLKKYNIQIIPSIVNKLNKLVVLGKDKTKKLERTNIVYEFSCIGETKRALNKRISDHRNNKNEKAVVHVHKSTYKHDFDFDSVKITDRENDYQKRLNYLRNVISEYNKQKRRYTESQQRI